MIQVRLIRFQDRLRVRLALVGGVQVASGVVLIMILQLDLTCWGVHDAADCSLSDAAGSDADIVLVVRGVQALRLVFDQG